jgi:hypothetical protein
MVTAEPRREVNAQELAQAYERNSVAADQQFKGKRFKVAGELTESAKNAMHCFTHALPVDKVIVIAKCWVVMFQGWLSIGAGSCHALASVSL